MTVSATGTVLSEDAAIQIIKSIIDSDPRVKAEIEARIKQINAKNSNAVAKLEAAPYLSKEQRNELIKMKKREIAVYQQYTHDNIFGPQVDNALA